MMGAGRIQLIAGLRACCPPASLLLFMLYAGGVVGALDAQPVTPDGRRSVGEPGNWALHNMLNNDGGETIRPTQTLEDDQ